MTQKDYITALATISTLCLWACDERTLDFVSDTTGVIGGVGSVPAAAGGASSAPVSQAQSGRTSIVAASGGAAPTTAETQTSPGGASTINFCEADRQLSPSDIGLIAETGCNAWAVELESDPRAVACRYKIPVTSADGTHTVDPARVNLLLRFSDRQTTRLNRNDPNCKSGFHFVGNSEVELNLGSCAQLRNGEVVLQMIYGCTSTHIGKIVIRMARENQSWGYTRIRGALFNLGHDIARNTNCEAA